MPCNDERSVLTINRRADIPRHLGLRDGVGGGTLAGLVALAQKAGGLSYRVAGEEVDQLKRERPENIINWPSFVSEIEAERRATRGSRRRQLSLNDEE